MYSLLSLNPNAILLYNSKWFNVVFLLIREGATLKKRKRKTGALAQIWDIFTNLLVMAVIILAILLAGVRLFGLRPFTVLSGSMEPTYHVGALIYVKEIDPFEIKVGDPITFMLNETTVATHRVVEIVPDETDPGVIRFRTKGDANEAVDGSLVHYKNVIGTPVYTIPKLGYLADYVQHKPGTYIAIAVGAIILLLTFLPDLFSEDSEGKAEKAVPQKSNQRNVKEGKQFDIKNYPDKRTDTKKGRKE